MENQVVETVAAAVPPLSIKSLLEAGVHFGHQTKRWNPKMKPYIFTARNGIHIINLEKTFEQLQVALKFVADRVALGEMVLFVGTKRQAKDIIVEQATRAGMYYVTDRWLGGMLTNFNTIKKSIDRLEELTVKDEKGEFEKLTKKEALTLRREREKLKVSLGGIKDMKSLPGVIFVVDPKTEGIALKEANRLGIPVVAVTDTNCDPAGVDYLVAGNDDAIRAIQMIVSYVADSCLAGVERRQRVVRDEVKSEDRRDSGRVREKKVGGRGRAYVSRGEKRDATETENKA